MSPRKFLNFLRSKTGLLILFLLATCVVLILANSRKNVGKDAGPVNGKTGPSDADSKKPQLIEPITRDMVPFRPPASDDKTPKVATTPKKRSEVNGAQLREEIGLVFRGLPLLSREGETRMRWRGQVRY